MTLAPFEISTQNRRRTHIGRTQSGRHSTHTIRAMDYSFFGATPQPYFMGMPNNGFGQGVDPDTIRSIVSSQADMATGPRTALEALVLG